MRISARTLDDALGDIIRRVLRSGKKTVSSRGGAREFMGVLIELSDPRARFSRTEGRATLVSHLGETLWYLSGSDRLEFIEYYIPKYRKFIKAPRRAVRAPGAYGPRLFRGGDKSQVSKLLDKLANNSSDTRQAVLQIFDRRDLRPNNGDVPCTTTLQFLPRNGQLHLIATMRSNDVYRGFPGDVFAFTFIQELLSVSLGLEVGTYRHFVGSLHLYDHDETAARNYLSEGHQMPQSMPAMPRGDPWPSIAWLLMTEEAIRKGLPPPNSLGVAPYWLDLARLLRMKVLAKQHDMRRLVKLKNDMVSDVYDAVIRGRVQAVEQVTTAQMQFPGMELGADGRKVKK